jgi:hypothetical protein
MHGPMNVTFINFSILISHKLCKLHFDRSNLSRSDEITVTNVGRNYKTSLLMKSYLRKLLLQKKN